MNEVLSDTDNPSHLHLDLESNIFFLRKTYLPNYGPLDTMLQSVYPLHQRRKSLEQVDKLPQTHRDRAQADEGPPASVAKSHRLTTCDYLNFQHAEDHLKFRSSATVVKSSKWLGATTLDAAGFHGPRSSSKQRSGLDQQQSLVTWMELKAGRGRGKATDAAPPPLRQTETKGNCDTGRSQPV